jgi:uncharacterized protein YlxW (UPF0749 family)
VAASAGLLIGTNASLFRTEELGPDGLAGMVEDQAREVARLEADGERLDAELDDAASTASIPTPGPEGAWLDVATGRIAIEGPGITITLDDAPAPLTGEGDLPPDAYVVHQEDIEAVLNTLWSAGAEAVAIQGQRLTSLSGVRCVGNVLLLGGRTYSPPYAIDAVGDPDTLTEALETSPVTEPYRTWAASVGLAWSIRPHTSLRIDPGPGGSITLRYILGPTSTQHQGAL